MFLTELPKPILFHPLKHHLGYLREYVRANAGTSDAVIKADLLTLGSSQMDLYTGQLSAVQIAEEVITQLQHQDLLRPEAYRTFIKATGSGYQLLTLSDRTDWVLRWGVEEGRHVHLHPARYAANTMRVKANTLKTAVAMVTAAAKFKLSAIDLLLLNQLRQEWLGLSLLKTMPAAAGTGTEKLVRLLLNQKQETRKRW